MTFESGPDPSESRRDLLKLALGAPLLCATDTPAFAVSQTPGAASPQDANKSLVRSYISACDRGDLDAIDAIVAPNAQWWILGRRDFDRQTIMHINRARYPAGGERESTILGMAADGDRVAVEYETSSAAHGSREYNVFHHLFVIRSGGIVSVQEFLDPPPLSKPFVVSQAHPRGLSVAVPDPPSPAADALSRSVAAAFLSDSGSQMLSHELRASEFRWWLTGVGYHDLDSYISKMITTMKARPVVTPILSETAITGMTVEGGRVAVQVSRNIIFPNYDYINRFHIVLIVRHGKILEMREHNDLAAAIRGGLPVLESLS